MPKHIEQFGLIPWIIGWWSVIASLYTMIMDDIARILQSTKGYRIRQFRKLLRFQGADLIFAE
jgi:ATP-dependent protease Clp ATPase subunit